ncbi:hypothetical protein Trydic_g17934 [Trypoxylus dichotomus]
MVVGEANINNIMGGIENTGGVRLHNHKKKLRQRFDIIKKLGQGTYGKVQLGINKETGQEVAIKTIKKSKIETEADLIRIRREIQIMSSVQHPNIIHIYEVFENREKMVLVMEYAAGGELYDYLSERKVLAEEEARRIFRQIAIACYYCHKHKICHRDLKLENILLDENGNAKIADFGLSNVFDCKRLLSTFCGSPLYASPEIVKGTPYHGPEVDCWSLGVLLYTLVYGAMPFDGSNFKRLVRQISQGDYFEPKKPSPASPLIREMLTVNPKNRADIEKICSHWWVNEGYNESCLEISEYLANQTPVRLDLLLSLAPPPPQLESDKLVVTGDVPEQAIKPETIAPTRSQSVGSLMELTHPAEKRIKDLLAEEIKATPKRKLENAVSSDQANVSNRKDKIIKEHTVADISVHATIHENNEDASMTEVMPLDKSRTQTLSREMDVEQNDQNDEAADLAQQGAVCAEILEDAKKNEAKKPVKVKKAVSTTLGPKILEEINENPSQESLCNNLDKENIEQKPKDVAETDVKSAKKEDVQPIKKKPAKKGILTDKDENAEVPVKLQSVLEPEPKPQAQNQEEIAQEEVQPPAPVPVEPVAEKKHEEPESKPLERRRSRIYEQAEKLQNLMASDNKPAATEKPKKVILPGVNVGGYKKEFERKASLTSTSPPKVKCNIPKRISIDKQASQEQEKDRVGQENKAVEENKTAEAQEVKTKVSEATSEPVEKAKSPEKVTKEMDDDRKRQLKNAVSIISNALDKDKDGTRKSRSRPCIRKPPVPFGVSGRSASGSIAMITPFSPSEEKPPSAQGTPGDVKATPIPVSTPEDIKDETAPESKTSSAEITLKSATLPRRKTTKAEIHLNYPQPKPATMEFKTEMAHHVEAPPKLATQRSEAVFPVSAPPAVSMRSASVEPETKSKPKERIIPIAFEKETEEKKEAASSPPIKPPTPKVFQNQKSYQSQRSSSLSRQSTQESDSENTVSGTGEPIRKSPREYIIPIAVEGGGYVTPRAGSLEPSDTTSTTSTMTNSSRRSKFGRSGARRMNSLLNDREGSEDESPFILPRHSSFGKDSDTEDSRKDTFHMHRLRSSRPRRAALEHTDSLSSGEEDDDDGFEILTAENLFSTLLSRVRDLTQRINVDDSSRPGFPSGRLLSHFDHGSNFWNFKSRLDPFSSRTTPVSRAFSQERTSSNSSSARPFGAPWRRSVSRDLASDIESVFNEARTPTQTATLPRGARVRVMVHVPCGSSDQKEKKNNSSSNTNEDLNLSDLNLKQLKLSEEDAIALSYLTPGLSRRIQKQLLAQLPPSEAKKLTRTMSMRSSKERTPVDASNVDRPKGVMEKNQTLPRRYSAENNPTTSKYNSSNKFSEKERARSIDTKESQLDGMFRNKNYNRDIYSPVNDRSVRSESFDIDRVPRPRAMRSCSLREPRLNYNVPRVDTFRSPDPDISSYRNDDLFKVNEHSKGSTFCNSPDISPTTKSNIYTTDYSNSITRPSPSIFSSYSGENPTLNRYLSPTKYGDSGPRSYSPTYSDIEKKTESKRPSTTTRKISRFLRPDFYDKPKEENVVVKEKKEREMETQKVLKEIRDKRKNRLQSRRERSNSREPSSKKSEDELDSPDNINLKCDKITEPSCDINNLPIIEKLAKKKHDSVEENVKPEDTNQILNNISDSIKNIETNISSAEASAVIEEYPRTSPDIKVPKKEKISKLIRPKSYPADNLKKEAKETPEKEIAKSKIAKIKKDPATPQHTKNDPEKSKSPPPIKGSAEKNSNKNRFFQTIEKKFEKLRSFNNNSPNRETSVEKKVKDEKKSSVENAIKRLREQSLPRNIDHCITESGLIKRAVSVEDLTTLNTNTKELQSSRKSVTKILGLFKKYEEKDKDKKSEKTSKLKKPKDVNNGANDTTKSSQLKTKKVDNKGGEKTVINKSDNSKGSKTTTQKLKGNDANGNGNAKENPSTILPDKDLAKKSLGVDLQEEKERPKSLLYDFQKGTTPCKGAKSDTSISNDTKTKFSKLPVNSFRRSLNLDKTSQPKISNRNSFNDQEGNVINNDDRNNNAAVANNIDVNDNDTFRRPDRRNLKLDLNKIADSMIEALPSTSNSEPNRNSTTTDDSSAFLSPCDDNMSCDSWSVCSDYHTHDLLSPISPNGHIYSGDESESVIDRIRRKSFYTRFNEKKRPRKPSLIANYRDLDLYKDYSQRKPSTPSYRSANDYGSLDRRSIDYRAPSADRRLNYNTIPDHPVKREYKPYVRSSSLLNDYVNVPNRYQTYNPRMARHISSLYSPENEDGTTVDDVSSAGKSRLNSFHYQPSRINGRASSVSPSMDNLYPDSPTSYKHSSAATTSPHTSTISKNAESTGARLNWTTCMIQNNMCKSDRSKYPRRLIYHFII